MAYSIAVIIHWVFTKLIALNFNSRAPVQKFSSQLTDPIPASLILVLAYWSYERILDIYARCAYVT